MMVIGGVYWLLVYILVMTDLFLLGCFLFVKTRNEWRKHG